MQDRPPLIKTKCTRCTHMGYSRYPKTYRCGACYYAGSTQMYITKASDSRQRAVKYDAKARECLNKSKAFQERHPNAGIINGVPVTDGLVPPEPPDPQNHPWITDRNPTNKELRQNPVDDSIGNRFLVCAGGHIFTDFFFREDPADKGKWNICEHDRLTVVAWTPIPELPW